MAVQRTEQVRYRRQRPAVRAARVEARELAGKWGLLDHADTLESAISELVTNAVIHGRAGRGSHVQVAYRLTDERLRVEVRDAASGTPTLAEATTDTDDLPEGTRGLSIVAALVDHWGVIERVIGKTVWFEIVLKAATPADTAAGSS